MGTTADKLAYLNGTKAAIRGAITARGVELSESAPFRSYAEKIGEIQGGGGSMPPEPEEVYASQRPADWLPMPEPQNNEIYLLFQVPDKLAGQEIYQPTGRIYFTVTCSGNYTVEKGTVTSGAFVPSGTATTLASGAMYQGEFTAADCYNKTSDNMGQLMFRVQGSNILSWQTGYNDDTSDFASWNIVEIACRLPSATRVTCGDSNFDETALTSLRYFAWYGSNAMTDMTAMFSRCRSLQAVLALDTSNVTDMTEAFYWCSSLIALPELDTSKVTNMYYAFAECHSLYDLPALDTSGVSELSYVFFHCYSLRHLYWLDTSSFTMMEGAFYGCQSMRGIKPISIAASPGEGSLNGAFIDCRSLQHLEFSQDGRPASWAGDDLYLGNCLLFYTDLKALINSLPPVTTERTLSLDWIPGTLELTSADEQLAESKGWILMY